LCEDRPLKGRFLSLFGGRADVAQFAAWRRLQMPYARGSGSQELFAPACKARFTKAISDGREAAAALVKDFLAKAVASSESATQPEKQEKVA
jgi:hypothetical protein